MFNFPCISFRNIPNFSNIDMDRSLPIQRYEVTVEVSRLPLDLPHALSANNMNKSEGSSSIETFNQAINSGLVISAFDLQYQSSIKQLTVNFGHDHSLYGVINYDNYEIIKNAVKGPNYEESVPNVLVMELFTGITKGFW